MTSPSPSEFLTFMRTMSRPASRSLRRCSLVSRPRIPQTRMFATTNARFATGDSSDKQHATDKKDKLDVQSANAAEGRANKAQGTGGTATEAADSTGSTAKAKKDHPEAPDVVIGMQDERGSKGH